MAAAPSVLREGSPAPPTLALLGVGHAACLRGLHECSWLCPVLLPEPGTIREPSRFLGASRPRGISASHTWPEQRRGPGLPQPSGLRVAPGCPPVPAVESGSSSSCCPGPGGALGCRGPCFGFQWQWTARAGVQNSILQALFKRFCASFLFRLLNMSLGDRLDQIFHFPVF